MRARFEAAFRLRRFNFSAFRRRPESKYAFRAPACARRGRPLPKPPEPKRCPSDGAGCTAPTEYDIMVESQMPRRRRKEAIMTSAIPELDLPPDHPLRQILDTINAHPEVRRPLLRILRAEKLPALPEKVDASKDSDNDISHTGT